TNNPFNGLIDEVSVYNGALSAAEIQSLFAAGSDGKATVVVTTSADAVDATDGVTSLREAINASNATPGRDVIGFDIPTPPAGAVARWSAEKAANDTAGGNNGTLQGGASFADGVIGQAFGFDGVDDFISVANTGSLDFGSGDF